MPNKKTTFNMDWVNPNIDKDLADTFREVKGDPFSAFCKLCSKKFSLSNMGKAALKSHQKCAGHLEKMLAKKSTPNVQQALFRQSATELENISSSSTSTIMLDKSTTSSVNGSNTAIRTFFISEEVLEAEILWALHSVESHLSLNSANKTLPVLRLMFKKSEVAEKMKLSPKKLSYLITYGLAPYFQEQLEAKLVKCNFFVACFDESLNRIAQRGQMDICIRYWDEESQLVETRYLKSIFMNGAKATDILRCFKNGLKPLKLEKLLQVSMDGPNVNWKFLRILKEDGSVNILDLGSCGLHVVHGASQSGHKAAQWSVNEFLRGIYWLFKDSPARRAFFKEITSTNVFPLKFCSVRWVESASAAFRALSIFEPISKYMNIENAKLPNTTTDVEIVSAPTSFIPNTVVAVLFAVSIILTIYHFWFQSLRYVKIASKIPGPKPWPVIGNALEAVGLSPIEIMQKALRIYDETKSDVVKFYVGPKLYVAVLDPRDVELILGSNVHLEKSWEYKLFEPWLGEGLLISKGDKWRSHRKMIAPTFHSSILKSFMPVFNKNAKTLLSQLESVKGLIFDVHDYMSGTTVDILLETAMGVKKTEEDNTGLAYAKAVMDMCNILHLRHYKAWLRPTFIFNWTKMAKDQTKLLDLIHSLTRKVIKRKKDDYFQRIAKGESSLYKEAVKAESIKNGSENTTNDRTENYKYIRDDLEDIEENDVGEKKRLAFLDFMIEASQTNGNKLTDEEIKEEVDTIMFEGHDTTAAGSSFVLTLLGVHRDIQEKCVAELKEIFHDDWNRPITFGDTLQMKYLERVIMESLRMYPPVPLISRKVNEDVKLASADYTIPAGATVFVSQYGTHRHPKYWKNPDTFDPDNFLPENCQDRHYYAYFPFSAGPRSCVGRKYAMLKLKVILASVLRRFQVISTKKEHEFRLQADIILKRADGFSVRLEDRIVD